ncbi:MAG: hypothetical protein KDI90_02440 [Alphaproteobacteria bacterium]|nr:hypothetical protein [Alphaproteobacteria bacterium]MCB9974417.1 hypothetical protein [Rhodospirillales bacterium]
MKKLGRFLFCLSVLCASVSIGAPAWAQIKGQYNPQPPAPEEETLPPTVPRVFSSKVGNVKKAEKLDIKLYDVTTVFIGYTEMDVDYRKQMYDLIEPFKFQVTRRKEEFKKDIDNAKKTLKDNYKRTQTLIDNFERDYTESVKTFSPDDQKILEQTGKQAIDSLRKKSTEYFRLQADFIKTYTQLVGFILSNGGGYYYDSGRKAVAFYQGGHYTSFSKMVDRLNLISFNQSQLLKSFQNGPPL